MFLCFVEKLAEVHDTVNPDVEDKHHQAVADLLTEYKDIFGDKLQQSAPVRQDMPEVVHNTWC